MLRKLNLSLPDVVFFGAIMAALPWLSAQVFLALNGQGGTTPGYLDLFAYWQYYGDMPGQRGKLILATVAPWIGFAALLAIPLLNRIPDLYGKARWANEADIRRAGLRATRGLILGKLRGRFLVATGQLGALMFAPPRSGKGVGFVVPNLLNWHGSVLVTDIKFELFELTSGFRARHGQEVVLFAPLDPEGRTQRYNPLDFVSRQPGLRINDLQKLTHKLMPTPERGDPMWVNEGRDLLEGILLYLMDSERPATIGEASRVIRGTPDFAGWVAHEIGALGGRLDLHARLAFNGFAQKAAKEQSGVLSSVKGALSLWANPLIDRATAASDFDPSQLRRRPMTIYLGVAPGDIGRLGPLLGMFVQQSLDALLARLPGDDEPYPLLALLDEFTALGRMPTVEKGIAYFASYNITLAPIIQDLPQLREVYGQNTEKTFLSTSKYRIAYAQNNDETAAYLSRQLGTKTVKTRSVSYRGGNVFDKNVSETHSKRELMLPQEIMRLEQGKEILLVEANLPVLANKVVYYKDRAFKKRLLAPLARPEPTPPVELGDGPSELPVDPVQPEAGGSDPPPLSDEELDAIRDSVDGLRS